MNPADRASAQTSPGECFCQCARKSAGLPVPPASDCL